jgi:hypothetical protein
MDVWYILCKWKEEFLGKKTVTNQRLLTQMKRALSTFRVHFIGAVKNGAGGYNYSI